MLQTIQSPLVLPYDIVIGTLSPKMSTVSSTHTTSPHIHTTSSNNSSSLSLPSSLRGSPNHLHHKPSPTKLTLKSPLEHQQPQKQPQQQPQPDVADSDVDPFLAKYIKATNVKSILTNNQLYFESIDKQRKLRLLEIYQKYLQPTTTKNRTTHYNKQLHVYDYNDLKKYVHRVKSPLAKPTTEVNKEKLVSPPPSPVIKKQHIHPSVQEQEPVTPTIVEKVLPQQFMECSIDDIISLISRMLHSLITLNDKSVPPSISNPPPSTSTTTTTPRNSLLTRYHSRTPPSISTHTYLARLTRFNNFNPATLLTTIYYIDLLSHQYQPYFTLNSWTVHRFLLVATMLAQKSMEDFFYTNDHYAKVGGVALHELNCLELDFLNRVDWRTVPGKHQALIEEAELVESGVRFCGIRYAKDVLDLYYSQLIDLMGKNTTNDSTDSKFVHFVKSSPPPAIRADDEEEDDDDDDEEDDEDIDDYYDSEDDDDEDIDIDYGEEDEEVVPLPNIAVDKYDSNGIGLDGSSSPHLKRRYGEKE